MTGAHLIVKGSSMRKDNREEALRYIPQGCIMAEVGVHKGVFTRKILDVVRPSKLYAIDPWLGDGPSQSWYGISQDEMDARFHNCVKKFANDPEVCFIRAKSEVIVDGLTDCEAIYIDGDHRYEAVKMDIECALDAGIRIIILDDCRPGGWWKGGVLKAQQELLPKAKLIGDQAVWVS